MTEAAPSPPQVPNPPAEQAAGRSAGTWRDPRAWAALLALAVLLLAPQPVPPAIRQAFETAQAATARQDYAQAADALAEAAARLSFDSTTVSRAGLADISAGRFESAVTRLQAAARLDGWTPGRRVALGDAYLGLQDYARALEQWELARPDLLDDPGLLTRLARGYEQQRRYPEALAILTQLADQRSADPAVYYRLALLTTALAPDDAPARLELAAALAPDLKPVTDQLQQAIRLGQASDDAAYVFGSVGFALIQVEEWGLAEAALEEAVRLNAGFADAYAYLGLARDSLGVDGLEAYQQAIGLAPDSTLAQYLLGLHYRRLGKSDLALEPLKRAQALDPQNPAIAAELGGAYASVRDLVNAEQAFNQAVQLAPRDAQFWLLLARFHVENEYHVEDPGLPAARMAAGLAPDNALAVETLGYALVLTGDTANGEKLLEQAIAMDPQLPSPYYHIGLLYASQGRTEAARAAFDRTIALDPQGTYGGLALRALALISP